MALALREIVEKALAESDLGAVSMNSETTDMIGNFMPTRLFKRLVIAGLVLLLIAMALYNLLVIVAGVVRGILNKDHKYVTTPGFCGAPFMVLGIMMVMHNVITPAGITLINTTLDAELPLPTIEGMVLHDDLPVIVDLHADSLVWKQDRLDDDTGIGHFDIPRMKRANIGLQVFAQFSKIGCNMKTQGTVESWCDLGVVIGAAAGWPVNTLYDLTERILYGFDSLEKIQGRLGDSFRIIRTGKDLQAFLDARQENRDVLGGLLALEGGHPIYGDTARLNRLIDGGLRMMGLTHFSHTALCGSAHGIDPKYGLTKTGERVVNIMWDRGVLVDLAHASEQCQADVIDLAKKRGKPVMYSHTGIRAVCDSVRNIPDESIRGTVETNGVIGVTFFVASGATCPEVWGSTAESILQAIDHVVKIGDAMGHGHQGVNHVSLGSDWGGAVAQNILPEDLNVITSGLLSRGYSREDIEKIMGGNAIRLLKQELP